MGRSKLPNSRLGSPHSSPSGDVVAQQIGYSDASGHVMIVGGDNTVIGTGAQGNGPEGTIESISMPKDLTNQHPWLALGPMCLQTMGRPIERLGFAIVSAPLCPLWWCACGLPAFSSKHGFAGEREKGEDFARLSGDLGRILERFSWRGLLFEHPNPISSRT